jgi:hypothetical protein
MRKIILFLLLAAVLSPGALLWAQEIYYVQSQKAKVMSEPSFRGKVLGEASKGTKLVSSGRKGSWIKVGFYEKEGYVASLLLSKYPPMQRQTLIKGDESEIRQSVRRRASTYTSAAAARGLTHEDRKRASAEEEVDYNAVARMEALSFTQDEVTRFMEGGKL